MRAIIFADRLGAELEPLTEKVAVPLLPIVGKSLLVYCIEDLASAGIRELIVVICARGEQTEASSLGDGRRWGANIRYVLSRGEESPAIVWPRLKLMTDEPLIVLRGDVLRSPSVGEFLGQLESRQDTIAFCGQRDSRGSLLLIRPGRPGSEDLLHSLHWTEPKPLPEEGNVVTQGGTLNCLDDLAAFHRANLDVLTGRFHGLSVSGRSVAAGLHAGRGAKVSPKSLKEGLAYVGANSRIDPEAELLGEVVIGDNVVVDSGATVRDSVILPRTYVGALVDVGNAIVATNHLMRVDTGAVLKVSDAFLLSNVGAAEGAAPISLPNRLAGMLLVILSLPLWPVAAVAAKLSGDGPLLESREFLGNRRSMLDGDDDAAASIFIARNWRTRIPVLRNLPRLLAVARGDLRLVGVAPLTPTQAAARTEDWQRVRDQVPVGLLGPTQLNLAEDAPLEERLLSDAFYAREHGWKKDLKYLWQGLKMLFRAEGWGSGR